MLRNNIPIINLERCDRCGQCVERCPEDALVMTKDGPAFREPNLCTFCTLCENICPLGAIRAPLSIRWSSENQPTT